MPTLLDFLEPTEKKQAINRIPAPTNTKQLDGILGQFFSGDLVSSFVLISNPLIGTRFALPTSAFETLRSSLASFGDVDAMFISGGVPVYYPRVSGYSIHYLDIYARERDLESKLSPEELERYQKESRHKRVEYLGDAFILLSIYANHLPGKSIILQYSPEDFVNVRSFIQMFLSKYKGDADSKLWFPNGFPKGISLQDLKSEDKKGAVQKANYIYSNAIKEAFKGRNIAIIKHVYSPVKISGVNFYLMYSPSSRRVVYAPPSYLMYPIKQARKMAESFLENFEGEVIVFNSGSFAFDTINNKDIILPPSPIMLNEVLDAKQRANKTIYTNIENYIPDGGVLLLGIDKYGNRRILHIPYYALFSDINVKFRKFLVISDAHIGSQSRPGEISPEEGFKLVTKYANEKGPLYSIITTGDNVHGMQNHMNAMKPYVDEKNEILRQAAQIKDPEKRAEFLEQALKSYPIYDIGAQITTYLSLVLDLLKNTKREGPDLITYGGNHYANATLNKDDEARITDVLRDLGYNVIRLGENNDTVYLKIGNKEVPLVISHSTYVRSLGGADKATQPVLYLRKTGRFGYIIKGDSHEYTFASYIDPSNNKIIYGIGVSALQSYTPFDKNVVGNPPTMRGSAMIYIGENDIVMVEQIRLDALQKKYNIQKSYDGRIVI